MIVPLLLIAKQPLRNRNQVEMIQSNIDVIIKTALQPLKTHFLLATEALITLSNMAAIVSRDVLEN